VHRTGTNGVVAVRLPILIVSFWISFVAMIAVQMGGERVPETSPSDSGRISDLESRGGAQIVALGSGRGRLPVPLDVSEKSLAEELPGFLTQNQIWRANGSKKVRKVCASHSCQGR